MVGDAKICHFPVPSSCQKVRFTARKIAHNDRHKIKKDDASGITDDDIR